MRGGAQALVLSVLDMEYGTWWTTLCLRKCVKPEITYDSMRCSKFGVYRKYIPSTALYSDRVTKQGLSRTNDTNSLVNPTWKCCPPLSRTLLSANLVSTVVVSPVSVACTSFPSWEKKRNECIFMYLCVSLCIFGATYR